MGLKLITAPTLFPVTLRQAKVHLNVDGNESDAVIEEKIGAATDLAEGELNRLLLPQVWELALPCFPGGDIDLMQAPVLEIISIKYIDTAGVEQTLDPIDYSLDNYGVRHWAVTNFGRLWPIARQTPNAVKIQYRAGYADVESVPLSIKQWILMVIATWFQVREGVIIGTIIQELPDNFMSALLNRYRIRRF